MTKVYRALVYLVTFAIPVVIAACYGPAYRYRKGGKVLDKATKAPIAKIDVTCDQADGGYSDMSRTDTDTGFFSLGFDEPCTSITARDSLAAGGADAGQVADAGTAADAGQAADGGTLGERTARYATKVVPFDGTPSDLVIELDRSN